ncbi:MotA/TolQ/ExbB proton channel family protein [Burkholderia cenocepacia]|uniref:MotA/TolQ/ExbB proton channel family protein n=1 Tax=Burkholderia cepacia complex TaxID=87882 RepID=UPI001B90BFB9|nr:MULTISPECIES: MotA/TolQ/ExbB proton channel family protein [Burkholderia cepacia complex]MBR8040032.1 MotA/TolQ/ExbB proton channel family protein [Burkholderia cenocepacia]MBR8378364.1 MotA/TolQ/ExbB proton channel family protein [Burkholderia cenocepacia]MDN7559706.1 MotA/TolQ/ExbB proton channel family protein [Burkholderia orbicola]MDN7580663.1 MotA/TolQ/ExbB proton channel family protein [Burkholderia orbicola]
MEQYGIANVWQQGDFVTRFIFVFLIGMSVVSWFVILTKGFSNRRLESLGKRAQTGFWSSASISDGIAALGERGDNPYRALVLAGREANEQHAGNEPSMQGSLSASEWVARGLRNAFDDEVARLQNGLAVLGSIGSTAPFVGLFGTVWGIYHALMAIGMSGQASLDHVAGPVGESLVMTAIGLFVAIPAVLGFNYVNRGNKRVSHRLNRFAHELHVYFVTGAKARADAGRPVGAPVASKRATPNLAA